MVVINVLLDLVIDYNLIFFVADVQKDASVVPALSFAHEVFAILDSSKQNAQPRVEMVECLNRRKRTIRATAAAYFYANVT
jgi:hypothetical protein